jgi:hypothetical protein
VPLTSPFLNTVFKFNCILLCFWLTGNSGVWGLKKNFALLELLERLQYSHERATLFCTADLLEKERQVL